VFLSSYPVTSDDPGTDLDALESLYAEALDAEKSGDIDRAAAFYRRMLALDPDDCAGAMVRLAAMGQGEAPARAPEAYVMTLFDQQAEAFDHILVDQLGYHIPEQTTEMLCAKAPGPHARALDLGCGTGLMGLSLGEQAEHMTGIDLAENMVESAGDRGVYDDLYVGDAVAFLEEIDEPPWDLILATDVLPYLGDVAPLFAGAARCLAPGGWLTFSTELLDGSGTYKVGAGHRFQHDPAYLAASLRNASFILEHSQPATIRHEMGAPVPGEIMLARKA
jgi:predicted TPR repeat methyltransferase